MKKDLALSICDR